MKLKFKKLHPKAKAPTKAHKKDAGLDIYAIGDYCIGTDVTKISTGIAFDIPSGWCLQVHTRSSYGKNGIRCFLGIIDEEYKGEVAIFMSTNSSNIVHNVKDGDKIAQLLLVPVPDVELEEVKDLSESTRGDKGFGSSGR